jgi:hypothetical protein
MRDCVYEVWSGLVGLRVDGVHENTYVYIMEYHLDAGVIWRSEMGLGGYWMLGMSCLVRIMETFTFIPFSFVIMRFQDGKM